MKNKLESAVINRVTHRAWLVPIGEPAAALLGVRAIKHSKPRNAEAMSA